MSKRRGLSLEEKRKRMLDMFYEKKQVYQLKEVEKIASKEKGITSMAVKDVLQSLVDDNLVDSDRIGTSNYYWAFPSKASQARKRTLADLTNKLQESQKKQKMMKTAVEKASVGRESSKKRTELLEELSEKESLSTKLRGELDLYKEVDPEVLEQIKTETKIAQEAANRWTDNVFSIKSWCKKKFGMEEKVLDKQFGISEDFDYIE
ncbi:meiotic nuclear division protein 1 homolog [Apostichopus japonicus]